MNNHNALLSATKQNKESKWVAIVGMAGVAITVFAFVLWGTDIQISSMF